MKTIIPILMLLFPITSYGQTKLISFRSHSGNNANFRTAVEHRLFDIDNSNFGVIYNFNPKIIDTVMLTSDNRIIVVRKEYADAHDYPRSYSETFTSFNAREFFTANSIDSLKVLIHHKYRNAKMDSTCFIGFDKKFKLKKENR